MLSSFSCDRLKQNVLLYDEFWVPHLRSSLREFKPDKEREETAKAVELLISKRLVVEPPLDVTSAAASSQDAAVAGITEWHARLLKRKRRALQKRDKEGLLTDSALKTLVSTHFGLDELMSRLVVYLLWRDGQQMAFPVVFPFDPDVKHRIGKRQKVLSVVLKKFPEPNPNLPLGDLIDFKSAPETKEKFDKFWDWVKRVSEGTHDEFDIAEQIDDLLAEYTNHLRRLSKKTEYSAFKTLVTVTGDALENVVKLRFGTAVRTVFELRDQKIAAYESELRLPGSELAYVKEAMEALQQS